MKRIQIKKNGIVTNQFELPALEADALLAKHLAKHTFGAPAVYESVKNETTGEFEQVLVTPAEPFEIIETDITAELAAAALKADKIAKGKAARQTCEEVLDLIGGFNIDRELTFAQKNEMKLIFSDAKQALNDFQPGYAKYFINMIEADGILVTQQMKDLCLELLADY